MAQGAENHNTYPAISAWQVLTSLGDAIAVVDREYRVVWMREPLLDPDRPKESLIGYHCFTLFGDGKGPCHGRCPVAPVFADGRPHMVERHFIDPAGVERWREARAFPIVDSKGRVVYVARISFDITQRKLGEVKRRQEQDHMERSLAELNRLQLSQMPFQPSVETALTHRELEVLRLLAQGHKNHQLAKLLGISVNTVKRHIVNIFGKLEVNDRTQAAVWAARNGLV